MTYLDYLAFLSGENQTIPISEMVAILEMEDIKYKIKEHHTKVLILEAEKELDKDISNRLSMVHSFFRLIFECSLDINEIQSELKNVNFERFLSIGTTFRVRIKRIKCDHVNPEKLERVLGNSILNKIIYQIKVDLLNPKVRFIGLCQNNKFFFCLELGKTARKDSFERPTTKRPFFHPTAMKPHVARALVNLSHARIGEMFLDPFCGAGSILIEAGLIGCKILGSDVDRKMILGVRKNLSYYKIDPEAVICADVKCLPLRNQIQAIATDPPYGRSSSTHGLEVKALIREFLNEVLDLLRKGGRICFAIPKNIDTHEFIDQRQLKIIEIHDYYIHRSLTRKIFVLKKK